MATRYNINDFGLANPAYVGATVSFWTVSGGAKTATLATLYAAATGSTTLANPRSLDSDGKFSVPVYTEVPVIATVSGLTVADHDTGIMGLAEVAASASATAAAVSAAAALVSENNAETAETNAEIAQAAAEAAATSVGMRKAATVGGTADAITATFSPAFANLAASAGIALAIPLSGANTLTTPTLAIDGFAATTIVKWSATTLIAGDIPGGDFVGLFVYDASADKFQILNPAGATISQVDAEAGTSQVVKEWTAQRVAQAIAALSTSEMPRGYLAGLGLANNGSDATNDIDIAVGACRDSTNAADIVLASALTKQLDATWAAGTNQGGLDTGAIANTTYHVWVIKRSDTGVVDVLFSTSATAPTMPANYDYKRRIGSILRSSGAIRTFVQDGDEFSLKVAVLDINATNPGASAVSATLSVPTGIRVKARVNAIWYAGTTSDIRVLVSDLSFTDVDPSISNAPLANMGIGGATGWASPMEVSVFTNTSAQVRYRAAASGAADVMRIATMGWLDSRGRND